MRISLEAVIKLLIGVVVVFLVLSIIFGTYPSIKNSLLSFIGVENLQEEELDPIISNNLPFYDQFVAGYRECKLNPEAECYCQILYPGTPSNYVIEIINEESSTSLKVHIGKAIDYSVFDLTDPKDEIIKTEPAKEPEIIDNDVLYFVNRGGPLSSRPVPANGRLKINEFTLIHLQYAYENYIYSMKNVNGENRIDVENGLALYKFDAEKSALFPLEKTNNLKKCKKLEGLNEALNEFKRLNSMLSDCIASNQFSISKCEYLIRPLPESYSLTFENKKFILKNNEKEIISTDQLIKEPCLFENYQETKEENKKNINKNLNLADYEELGIYPLQDNICLLPYTLDMVQQRKLEEERTRIRGNTPIVPA